MEKVKNGTETPEEKQNKRERSINFSQEETELLVSLVEARKYVIENKKSGAVTWQEKEKAWKSIEKAFNCSGKVFRDHKHLKLKYEALKRDIRKKIVQAENYSGGGTVCPILSLVEQKVRQIIDSVDGNESDYDSGFVQPTIGTVEDESCDSDFVQPSVIVKVEENESNDSDIVQPSKPREKRSFEKLTDEKIEIAQLQKKMLTEELHQKSIQRKILEEELQHKRIMHDLEKQHLMLKIELLKKDLDKNK